MDNYQVVWRNEAVQDISEHIVFLSNISFDAAVELRNELYNAVESSKVFPERNAIFPMPEKFVLEIRKLVVNKRYIVLYSVAGNVIKIYRALDARRHFNSLI